ncbi:MAG: methylenetetrahydrofolate reductase [Candidatus Hydrothermarchaeota archaeon]|nr:methylenetetrahydrofolate reductase [Candidatus Hydrothermarchaeota archaeon]
MRVYSELMKSLTNGKFTITSEIDSPKGTNTKRIIESAKAMKGYVAAINVVDCPMGSVLMNSLVPCYLLYKATGIESILQMTCRDRNIIGIQADLLGAAALGIKNVLAITGDHPSLGDHPQAKPVFDLDSVQLVKLIRKMVDEGTDLNGNLLDKPPKFHVGVAANPASSPLEPEIIKLEKKVEAGAEFVQTQGIYDMDILDKFLDATSHLDIKMLIGVIPLKSIGMAKFLSVKVPGIVIPGEIIKRLQNANDPIEESISISAEILKDIAERKVAGAHIMAVRMEHIVPRIIEHAGI